MAVHDELDKFVRKFVNLWHAGYEANLHVEAKAGVAVVDLKVSLGKAYHGGPDDGSCYRVGSPSRQRRRERCEAARKATAEEVVTDRGNIDDISVTEQVVKNEDAEETNGKIENLEYELKVDAHLDCKNYEIIEAVEVNFDATLDDLKVEKENKARDILVWKEQDINIVEDEDVRKFMIYKVRIRNSEESKAIVESWKESHTFDDLTFMGAVRNKNLRIR